MSSGSKLSFSFAGGWKAIGPPMHGLAESDWLVVMAVCCNRLPDASSGIIWMNWSDCCASFHEEKHPVLQSLVRIPLFVVPIPSLLGLHVPMQKSLRVMLLELGFQCTSDLDHLRRVRREQDQFGIPKRNSKQPRSFDRSRSGKFFAKRYKPIFHQYCKAVLS